MVSVRSGKTSLGCLFSLLVVSAALYFGTNAAEAYWRYFEFQDEMKQQVRFAAHLPNDQILRHLQNVADSLGLPDDAGRVVIRRANSTISIESSYQEMLELPGYTRALNFNPHAQGDY